jgi:hypothetical protein
MNTAPFIISSAIVCLGLAAAPMTAPPENGATDSARNIVTGAPAIPALPADITEIISARAFTLEQPYEFDWRKERPLVSSGYVLVLKVDSALVYPRQVAEPILFVGDQTAEKVNVGSTSGRLVVIVPAPVKADGSIDLDLSQAPIWFGEPGLPEQVDAVVIKQQRDIAARNKIAPRPDAEIREARSRGGRVAQFADKNALLRSLAGVVREFAPDEAELATGLETQGQ